jgi:ADP-dependent phosphofructokinase/glucokinase
VPECERKVHKYILTEDVMNTGWNTLYQKCIPSQISHFSSIDSIFLAYNMNIDMIKHLKPEDIQPLEKTSFFPQLEESMLQGQAREVLVTKEEYEWLKTLHYDKKSIGGQAGIMANLFSLFPIREIVIYSPAFCTEQAQYVNEAENLKVPDENCRLRNPHHIKMEKKPDYHFIFEFKKGMEISAGIVPRDNRFIASCPLQFCEPMCEDIFKRAYEYAIISGFHLITDTTPLKITKRHVDILKKTAKVHYECASIPHERIKKALIPYLRGFYSIGVNECELKDILDIHGEYVNNSIIELYEGLKFTKKALNVKRIQLHHLGFYLTIIDEDMNPEKTRDAALFAALLAAVKAQKGLIKSCDDALQGLKVPVSPVGVREISRLASYTGNSDLEYSGIFKDDTVYVIVVPARVVKNPSRTVGLGDTISGLAFLGE